MMRELANAKILHRYLKYRGSPSRLSSVKPPCAE